MHRRLLFWALALATLPAAAARAEVLSFTSTVVADYEFSLLGGTPLNPGPTTPFIPFRAVGDLTFTLHPSLNDPSMPTTVPFVSVTGVLQGVPPSPGNTLPHTISPNVQFLGGSLTNIVRDGAGEVLSANVVNLSSLWEMIGMSPAFPVRLYTQQGLPFAANNVTIPFQVGTVLAGAPIFNVYLDDGDGNLANDVLVVEGRNRTLTVVPEPGTGVLLAAGAVTSLGYARWRRRRLDASAT